MQSSLHIPRFGSVSLRRFATFARLAANNLSGNRCPLHYYRYMRNESMKNGRVALSLRINGRPSHGSSMSGTVAEGDRDNATPKSHAVSDSRFPPENLTQIRRINLASQRSRVFNRVFLSPQGNQPFDLVSMSSQKGRGFRRVLQSSQSSGRFSRVPLSSQSKGRFRRVLALSQSKIRSGRKVTQSSTKNPQFPKLGGRAYKRWRTSPPVALACWLDLRDNSAKAEYWDNIRNSVSPSSLPSILLQYLHGSSTPNALSDDFEQSFVQTAKASLQSRRMTMDDVEKWAWIISGQSTDSMVERFISTTSKKPTFLLLEILRRDILQVKTLQLVLIYVWDQILGTSMSNLSTISDVEVDKGILCSEMIKSSLARPPSESSSSKIEETTFIMIISRLLSQARRIWPPAMVSIAHMVAPYIHSNVASKSSDGAKLDTRTHARLCKLHNHLLRLLCLPSSIEPLKSMAHNWTAQRVLLEMGGNFEPPLTLDHNSYRAVIQVLAASKKSDRELKVAALRTRSWPPWRVDQDGMDARRSPEEDLSRVLSAAIRMKEAGYSESLQDEAMKILGGQESDGTPTIQSRKLVKRRARRSAESPILKDLTAEDWSARIEATRDIREAWSAFVTFQDRGASPSLSMYYAMFQKLNYESARFGRWSQHEVSPGDGKEPLPIPDDNFTIFYQSRSHPPTLDVLYQRMIETGLRPSGRCLDFLVKHARTTDEGLRYLRDSPIDGQVVEFLGGFQTGMSPMILEKLPLRTLSAFISLLCRFAPRATLSYPEEGSASASKLNRPVHGLVPVDATEPVEKANSANSEWSILERPTRGSSQQHRLNPLLQAVELLNQSQTRFRPAWYALFGALARRHVVVDRRSFHEPKNDIMSYRVLIAALGDFHRCGLELDPWGFQLICKGFEKAILASFNVSEAQRISIIAESQLVKDEFSKLSYSSPESPFIIPELLHSINGAQIHAYVRVLGLCGDHDEIISVLEWMVKHQNVLTGIANQSRNGPRLLRRAIVAMKVFCGHTEYDARAERLVECVDGWGGWPQEREAQEYIDHGLGEPEIVNVSRQHLTGSGALE